MKNSIGMELVEIPAGSFAMGQTEGGDDDERPVHQVIISRPFAMTTTPVTNAQYECFDPQHRNLRGKRELSRKDDEAAIFVSWHDAVRFCAWLSESEGKPYRLPTEAEWEYAARGPNGRTYPWGEARPNASRARFGGQERKALKIGSLPQGATLEGVHDLAGNVAEWVQDWWHPSYYAESPPADPQGPADGDYRVARGGSWNQPPDELRSSARLYHNPDKGAGHIGFRCAQSAGF